MKLRATLLLIVLLPAFSSLLKAQVPGLSSVREQFFKMQEVKDGPLNLYFRLKPFNLSDDPVLLAYRGAASAASAGSVSGVNKKLSYFSNGKTDLENAVIKQPGNPEIRFLRLATQINAPAFLGYRSHIDSDKKIVLEAMARALPNDRNAYFYYQAGNSLLSMDFLTREEADKVAGFIRKFEKK